MMQMYTRDAVILHGKPSLERLAAPDYPGPTNAHWLPWLRGELLLEGVPVSMPSMPNPAFPVYDDWREVFEQHSVGINTMVVAHSAGAGFILRWLSEHDQAEISKLVLVAPWLDPNGRYGDFGKFSMSKTIYDRCQRGATAFYSDRDDDQAIRSMERVVASIPNIKLRNIPEYGHFMLGNTMASSAFPEVLEELV